jgi:hypothetical protein
MYLLPLELANTVIMDMDTSFSVWQVGIAYISLREGGWCLYPNDSKKVGAFFFFFYYGTQPMNNGSAYHRLF